MAFIIPTLDIATENYIQHHLGILTFLNSSSNLTSSSSRSLHIICFAFHILYLLFLSFLFLFIPLAFFLYSFFFLPLSLALCHKSLFLFLLFLLPLFLSIFFLFSFFFFLFVFRRFLISHFLSFSFTSLIPSFPVQFLLFPFFFLSAPSFLLCGHYSVPLLLFFFLFFSLFV